MSNRRRVRIRWFRLIVAVMMLVLMVVGLTMATRWVITYFRAGADAEADIILSTSVITQATQQPSPSPPLPTATLTPTATPSPTPPGSVKASIRAVGDLMVHEKQYQSHKDGDEYDFTPAFTYVSPVLQNADLTIGNLETTISVNETYSGYPSFRSPASYLDALSQAGFDALTFANNHTFDAGINGINHTLEEILERGMQVTGAYSSSDDSKKVLIMDVEGISVAILAYSEMRFSTDAWRVGRLSDTDKIREDVKSAREQGADIVLAMVHWGVEYAPAHSTKQREQALTLARTGIDVILGSHPHVAQGNEWLSVETEDGTQHSCFVAYSMGNFFSNQRPTKDNGNAPTDAGLIYDVQIEKDLGSGETRVTQVSAIPTWVLRRSKSGGLYTYHVLPIEEILNNGGIDITEPERERMRDVLEIIKDKLGDVPTIAG